MELLYKNGCANLMRRLTVLKTFYTFEVPDEDKVLAVVELENYLQRHSGRMDYFGRLVGGGGV